MTKTQQPAVFYINAALFDCDGTLVNSTGAISEFWRDFGKTRPHVDPEEIIRTSHGCRTYDVIAKWSPADADVEQVTAWEGAIPDTFGEYAKPIPGAVELVKSFDKFSKEQTENGQQRWAVVTSGTLPLATKWLKLLTIENQIVSSLPKRSLKVNHIHKVTKPLEILWVTTMLTTKLLFSKMLQLVSLLVKVLAPLSLVSVLLMNQKRLENLVPTLSSRTCQASRLNLTTKKLMNSKLLLVNTFTLMTNSCNHLLKFLG